MALTPIQRDVCRLLAKGRRSGDIELFHDTDEALRASWEGDRALLGAHGFAVAVIRERPTFVEARVTKGSDTVLVEWARDSAYRFFPLVEHDDLGLVLHPFDLATNKVLALVGRLEPRDWIDVITCDERLQPLGYLAWAACGKDPGFTPQGILAEAARSGHYSVEEIGALDFAESPPDARALSRRWHATLAEAQRIVAALPSEELGRCVLTEAGALYRADSAALTAELRSGTLRFHAGSIRGAFPQVR